MEIRSSPFQLACKRWKWTKVHFDNLSSSNKVPFFHCSSCETRAETTGFQVLEQFHF